MTTSLLSKPGKHRGKKADRTSPRRQAAVKAKLVRIGNSRGVRLPKAFIEQAGLEGEIELFVLNDEVIVRSARHPRAGWAESIRAAVAKHGHDVDEEFLNLPSDFDEREWTWPKSNLKSILSHSTRRSARK